MIMACLAEKIARLGRRAKGTFRKFGFRLVAAKMPTPAVHKTKKPAKRDFLIARCFLAGLGLCGLLSSVHAATLDQLRAFVRDTQTARARFTQTNTDPSGRVTQTASGEFLLERPGKFRWSVNKPYQQLLVGDGQRVWVFDQDLNQVIVRRLGEALSATPAALLAGNQDVERAFEWQDLPPADGLAWLAATPLAKDSTFTEIRLGFDAQGLSALVLFDAFGQRSEIRFTSVERNPRLAAELFRFTPPPEADVIGER
jgi:outer membrane lipoprotein carrier protein